MGIKIGDSASRTTTITDGMIRAFADLSGDHNPIHLDDDFAANTRFGGRIAHGMISAGLISAVLANDLPGAGCVYTGQTIAFKAPVYPNDTICITVTINTLDEQRGRVTLTTTGVNQNGVLVVDGEAKMLLPRDAQASR